MSSSSGRVHAAALIRAGALVAGLVLVGWILIWVFRLGRAVLLPGNLALELHVVEVGLLAVLGLDLLVRAAARPGVGMVLPDGRRVRPQRVVVLGSDPGPAGVRIDGPAVSRRHLEVRPREAAVEVRDLGSTNGTWVDRVDLRGRGWQEAAPGGGVRLGVGGPEVRFEAGAGARLLGEAGRVGLVLALLWIGLGLGWAANRAALPPDGIDLGAVGSLSFDLSRRVAPVAGVAVGLSALVMLWSVVVSRRASGREAPVHGAVQLLLVLGVVTLYPLLSAESLRYARAAERAVAAVGVEAFEAGSAGIEGNAEADPAAVQRVRAGRNAWGLARALEATWLRQTTGLAIGAAALLVGLLAWRGAGRVVRGGLGMLARPLGGGWLRPLLYGDVLIGLAAAVVVVVTVATPLGVGAGRGRNLFLQIPGVGTVQSIELVKALFLVFLAVYLARVGRLLQVVPRARYLGPFLLATAGVLAMTAVQADMGGLVMLGLFVSGAFVLGTGAWRLMATVPMLLGAGIGLVFLLGRSQTLMTRLALWLDPRHHPTGEQVVNARQLLLSSGWLGHVPERALAWRIPDVHGDLVIAAVVERFGLVGALGLTAAWAALVVALLRLAGSVRERSAASALLLGGVAVLLTVQVLTQWGGALGLMPFTGVPLPWLSHGMTASLVFTGLVALALAAGRGETLDGGAGAPAALPARRVRLFVAGTATVFLMLAAGTAWWCAAVPAFGDHGERGGRYVWVDRERLESLDRLVAAGVFVPSGSEGAVAVDRGAYARFRKETGSDPGLVELMRVADGLRASEGTIVPATWVVANPNRFAHRALPRGWIVDRTGRALAREGGGGGREYPLGAAALHVVGLPRGLTEGRGLEDVADGLLEGTAIDRVMRLQAFVHDIHHGLDLELTLDAGLQQNAWEALQGRRGAAVVMDAEDGALLALVSSPAPDPEAAGGRDWRRLAATPDLPLLDRATASTLMYSPPGSTFKMVTALAGLTSAVPFDPGAETVCDGFDEELHVRCAHGTAHGRVDLAEALTVSCNVYFARLAVQLGPEAIRDAASALGFGQAGTFDLARGVEEVELPVRASTVLSEPDEVVTPSQLARVGYGQGQVNATPLQMARVAGVIATGGELLDPFVVRAVGFGRTIDDNGSGREREMVWRREVGGREGRDVVPRHVARQLDRALREVLEDPRGSASSLPSLWHGPGGWRVSSRAPGGDWNEIPVSGKTGSAWRTRGDATDDSWMVLWGPSGDARMVVCVMVEDAGTGARVAGPIAMNLLARALQTVSATP